NDGQDLVTLSIWDIAGQERFSFFRTSFYKGAVGALVVFDLTRYPTFNPSLIKWIKELWGYSGDKVPIVLIGNKIDLSNMRSVRKSDAKDFAEKVPCPYFETSAKEGQNVEDAFMELAYAAVEYWDRKNPLNF
ncbi:MAG: GTP-binding protein, partial [Candidatus Helarchaeota archaeon]